MFLFSLDKNNNNNNNTLIFYYLKIYNNYKLFIIKFFIPFINKYLL